MKSSLHKKKLGDWGEKVAALEIEKIGYSVISKNYYTRFGEIDIIAKDGDVLVFIEVKTRQSDSHGSAIESISKSKQRNIQKAIHIYLSSFKILDENYRFDVVTLDKTEKGTWRFNLLKNAFDYL